MNKKIKLKKIPNMITMPDIPEPTSYSLTKKFFINHEKICKKILHIFGKNTKFHLKNFLMMNFYIMINQIKNFWTILMKLKLIKSAVLFKLNSKLRIVNLEIRN